MASAEAFVAAAAGELGNTESPAGSNRTKYGKWFGLDGYPWCMMFVQWCAGQAGVELPKRTASCGDLMRAAQLAGCWITKDLRPGDVVIYDFPGGAATDHCGIVEAALPGYGVRAIEGNTSVSGSQSNGGMVCRKERPNQYIAGAVRPRLDTEEDDMDKERFKELWQEIRQDLQDNDAGGWSEQARNWAVQTGLIQGSGSLPDGAPNYMWEDLLTREQMAVLLYRFAVMAGMVEP